MSQHLSAIKQAIKSFKKQNPGKEGKSLRYPAEIISMIASAKNSGVSYNELAEASGLSLGGLEKMVTRAIAGKKMQTKNMRPKEAPKKRGRPAKNSAQLVSPAPKKRGRPAKNSSQPSEVKRGRGRPKGSTKPKLFSGGTGGKTLDISGAISIQVVLPDGQTLALKGKAADLAKIIREM